MITSLIVPPLSPPFPPPVIITSFIHTNKHSVGAFVDSKDLLQLVKELLCFDDWAAGNFKGTAAACDWLAAQQSPYHILGGAPAAVSQGGEPGGGATCPLTNSPGTRDPVGGWVGREGGQYSMRLGLSAAHPYHTDTRAGPWRRRRWLYSGTTLCMHSYRYVWCARDRHKTSPADC